MNNEIKATVDEKRKVLIIEVPLFDTPVESSTGKMDMIASSQGFKNAGIKFKGQEVRLNVMAGFSKGKK